MTQTKKVAAMTLGCKVNMYDTEAILSIFSGKGYEVVDFEQIADVYIVNTCTVTNLSDKKSRQMIRRARKLNKDAVIVATGCYAQVSPDEVGKIEDINIITGTGNRLILFDLVENYKASSEPVVEVSDIFGDFLYEGIEAGITRGRTRTYMKIQDGCNQFCSYCIIPYARGTVRSRRASEILSEAQRFADNGYKEIVLAGIHVASYGKDLSGGIDLCDLLRCVHETKGIERIRLSSLEPGFVTEKFIELIGDLPKLCNHFHLSLQSGCDKTLHAMNRKYTCAGYKQAVEKIRKVAPEAGITTDIIVGFPGETNEDFLESYNFAKEIGFSKIHVFPYSPKKGTPAEGFSERVSNEEKQIRTEKMLKLSECLSKEFYMRHVGETVFVLFEEKTGEGIFEGHTSNYMKVRAEIDFDIINKILPIKILNIDYNMAYGEKIR